jgi:hypothetical protein
VGVGVKAVVAVVVGGGMLVGRGVLVGREMVAVAVVGRHPASRDTAARKSQKHRVGMVERAVPPDFLSTSKRFLLMIVFDLGIVGRDAPWDKE